jgi:ElaA protein
MTGLDPTDEVTHGPSHRSSGQASDRPADEPSNALSDEPVVRAARLADIPSTVLYALLKLRGDVFTVEQAITEAEIDGRDTEPGTLHMWLAHRPDEPIAYLRVLTDSDGPRIGRVVTVRHLRGRGHAGSLLDAALERIGARTVRLNAQTQATAVYARRGFVPAGDVFHEAGIPHLPMVRVPAAGGGAAASSSDVQAGPAPEAADGT